MQAQAVQLGAGGGPPSPLRTSSNRWAACSSECLRGAAFVAPALESTRSEQGPGLVVAKRKPLMRGQGSIEGSERIVKLALGGQQQASAACANPLGPGSPWVTPARFEAIDHRAFAR